ncbi:cytochrome P450 [Streptomyces griseocarneus]|nr:cytochrome P450 [Streptomyces griseocarneus]
MTFRTADVHLPDPYPLYRHYRETDPVHLAADGTWYLFRHADVERVLSGREYVRGPLPGRIPQDCPHLRRTVGRWMVFMDPPEHSRVRALVAKAFTPRVVEELRPRVALLAAELAAGLEHEGGGDLVEAFAAPLPVLVISELLGVPREDRAWFRARALDLQQATGARVARRPDGYAVADAAARELDTYFRAELARRRAGRTRDEDDLIAGMLAHSGATDDDVLVGTCVHLLTAGHETTTNLLAKGLLALLAHGPAGTVPLDARAVEELIRYDPPVQMVTRLSGQGSVIGGLTVPGGSRLTLVLGSANRDPARFPDPDRLDLHRDPGRHCGFGLGIHYCVGAALARLEGELGLNALRAAAPGLTVEGVTYADDLVFHGPARMLVRV